MTRKGELMTMTKLLMTFAIVVRLLLLLCVLGNVREADNVPTKFFYQHKTNPLDSSTIGT